MLQSATVKTFKIVLVSVVCILLIIGALFFAIGYYKPKPAGIAVRSTPDSEVYVDGRLIGKTPIDTTLPSGTITLKIIPSENLIPYENLVPYETKLNLIPGVKTIVKRELGTAEASSSGEIVSFEKDPGVTTAGLLVVSTPSNAQVTLDGVSRGFSPLNLTSVVRGEHRLIIKSPGFTERSLTIMTIGGYKLTVFVQLSKIPEIPKEETKPEPQNYVVIGNTPTGFLRVRDQPGSKGAEIDQVAPGRKFLLLETDIASGWYKIQLEAPVPGLPNGRAGWVSNEFASVSSELKSQ